MRCVDCGDTAPAGDKEGVRVTLSAHRFIRPRDGQGRIEQRPNHRPALTHEAQSVVSALSQGEVLDVSDTPIRPVVR